jgi:hypothetical protein
MGDMRSAYKYLVGKHDKRRLCRGPEIVARKNNMNLKKTGYVLARLDSVGLG